jgi:hypothetical protein
VVARAQRAEPRFRPGRHDDETSKNGIAAPIAAWRDGYATASAAPMDGFTTQSAPNHGTTAPGVRNGDHCPCMRALRKLALKSTDGKPRP